MPNCFNFDPYCVIVSTGFPISFNKLIISCPKPVFTTHSVDQMKKQPKFYVLLQTPSFKTYSLMVFPFEKFLTVNLKTSGLTYS